MTGSELQLVVGLVELLVKVMPGIVEVGANLIDAIRLNGDLTPEQKSSLIARVTATRAAVRAYEPRPHPGSPSADDVPEPKPTRPG